MIGLHAAGITDVGRQRAGNEDALHVGDSVFAVADGMGGHQAGEVASALALQPIAALDGRVFGDVDEARAALGDAVIRANRTVVDAALHDDALQGMGTTLTAALFEGRRLHVAHVGDSRAYLLRGGDVVQLTRDHTFVQQLLDDGRITADEVATHPHRSVVTRAIGAREEVEVDLQTLDLRHGDAVLLCSDGLSGPVEERVIADLMRSDVPPAETVTALVEAANEAGGPDNITAVLLTVVNTRDDVAPYGLHDTLAPTDEPTLGHDVVLGGTIEPGDVTAPLRLGRPAGGTPARAGEAAAAGTTDHPGPDASPPEGPVGRARATDAPAVGGAVGTATAPTDPDRAEPRGPVDAEDDPRRPRRPEQGADGRGHGAGGTSDVAGDTRPATARAAGQMVVIRPDGDAARMRPLPGPGPDESLVVDPAVRRRRIGSIVVAVAVVLGLFIGGGRWLLSRSYFVGLDEGVVVIYRGIPAGVGPVELSWVHEETGLTAGQLPEAQLRQVEQGIAAANATDARQIVGRLSEAANADEDEDGPPNATQGDAPPGDQTGDPPGDQTGDPPGDQTGDPSDGAGEPTAGTATP